MKKSMLFVCGFIVLFYSSVAAQDILRSEVPEAILTHFDQEFSKATDVEWEKEGDFFKVDFELKRRIDMEIRYDSVGNIVRREEEWRKSQLPAVVVKAISSDYPDFRIEDVKKITKDDLVQYKLDLESAKQEDLNVWIDADGKVLDTRLD